MTRKERNRRRRKKDAALAMRAKEQPINVTEVTMPKTEEKKTTIVKKALNAPVIAAKATGGFAKSTGLLAKRHPAETAVIVGISGLAGVGVKFLITGS